MESVHLESVLAAALFAGVRIGGLMLFAPFFGSAAIPVPLKAALTVALTALLYPVYGPARIETSAFAWVAVVGSEAIIGLLLGLAVQFVLEAAQMAGQILGVQAGYSLVTLLDPQTQADTPVMATFCQMVALLIFLQANAHHWLLRALAASFSYLPPGSALEKVAAGRGLIEAAGGIFLAGFELAAPVVTATLVVDAALGFLAKASPQMPVLFLGLPVKNVIALSVLTASLALWPRWFEHGFAAGFQMGERCLHLAK